MEKDDHSPEEKQPSRAFRLDEILTVATDVQFVDYRNDEDPNAFANILVEC